MPVQLRPPTLTALGRTQVIRVGRVEANGEAPTKWYLVTEITVHSLGSGEHAVFNSFYSDSFVVNDLECLLLQMLVSAHGRLVSLSEFLDESERLGIAAPVDSLRHYVVEAMRQFTEVGIVVGK